MSRARDFFESVELWSGGVRVTSNAGEQYLTGSDDFVESQFEFSPQDVGEQFFVNFSASVDQLDHLATALESTDATYKLILSHVPINLDHADQGLFQFVLADNNERGRLIRMFSSENALYLAGHHHKGDVLSSFSESFHEYVFPAFHRKDLLWGLESRGYYHILTLNEDTGEVVIKSYQIQDESLEAERTINFSL